MFWKKAKKRSDEFEIHAPEQGGQKSGAVQKKKILLIDDEVVLTRMVKLNLEATGRFEVKTENDSKQALSTAHEFQPDLIFLDIVMRDIEGSEVADRLQGDSALSRIPIVFLTATITPAEVGSSGGVIGGQHFLAKPVTTADLVNCIERFTGK
jgi:CheY-like chemotaxis protein